MKRILAGIAIVVVLAAGYFGYRSLQGPSGGRLDILTAPLARGDVKRIVATSGSVKARVTVDVGTQISGQISSLGADFNSRVKKGDILARIDPATFEARLRQAEASLAVAEAGVAVSSASVEKASANLLKADRDLERARALAATGTGSKAALDAADTARAAAGADLSTARAQLENAKALVKQREAELESARIDIGRTLIRSPIDGVVIDRVVEVGQTVAASLSTPKLFTLAEDLAQVEIDAQVDEADIGQIVAGNAVAFTVDAFPEARFSGTAELIRLSPTTVSNVVTYTVVILAENPAGRLLPGMTANVEIVTGERVNTLVIANEALRFQPRGAALARVKSRAAAAPGGPAAGGAPGGAIDATLRRLQQEFELDEPTMARIRTALAERLAGFRRQGARPGAGARPGGDAAGGAAGASPGGDPAAAAGEAGAAANREAAGAAFREQVRAGIETAMREALTPAQFARYQELGRAAAAGAAPRFGTVWTLEAGGMLAEHRVRLGLADSSRTEILGADLAEGVPIVLRAREVTR